MSAAKELGKVAFEAYHVGWPNNRWGAASTDARTVWSCVAEAVAAVVRKEALEECERVCRSYGEELRREVDGGLSYGPLVVAKLLALIRSLIPPGDGGGEKLSDEDIALFAPPKPERAAAGTNMETEALKRNAGCQCDACERPYLIRALREAKAIAREVCKPKRATSGWLCRMEVLYCGEWTAQEDWHESRETACRQIETLRSRDYYRNIRLVRLTRAKKAGEE